MLLDSARELKDKLTTTLLAPFLAPERVVKSLGLPAGPLADVSRNQPSIALGIARRSKTEFQLAVRCQRKELLTDKVVDQIRKKAKDEVDIRYIGHITKRAISWTQQRHRPLALGISVGHEKITAGTLGAFVRDKQSGMIGILSNNHVLANENRGRVGDVILQPGAADDGGNPKDQIASLTSMVRVKKNGANFVDVAFATLNDGQEYDPVSIRGFGKLAGLGSEFVDEGTEVAKLGRTTGLTHGRVTAFELDNVIVGFDIGNLKFDNQLEIEGQEEEPFSQGGDSGSIIIEESNRLAVGLLFAGSEEGGTNGMGLTYANPIHTVLKSLKVDLVLE